jgi:chromosome segregation ATPase
MEFIFSIGNLITLGIVGITLAVFRQFDRNNRGLEKVRKYAEKLKEDLAAFVSDKEAAVRDYSTLLDVKQQSAKELMNRIQTTDEELAVKIDAVNKIDERLNVYDGTLAELTRMTGRVQENINWIKEKSPFVDSTHKRITDAREKVETVERLLDALQEHFERENSAALEKIAQNMTAETLSKLVDLRSTALDIERQVNESRESIERADQERAERMARDAQAVDAALTRALERASASADTMEDAVLAKLKEQAVERIQQLQANIEERFKTHQENARAQLDEFQSEVKKCRSDWENDNAELASQQRMFKIKWEKDIQELSDLVHAQHAAWEHQQDSWTKAVETGDAARTRLLEELEHGVSALRERAALENAALEERLNTAREAAAESVSEIEARLTRIARDTERQMLNLSGDRLETWQAEALEAEAKMRQILLDVEQASNETKKRVETQMGSMEDQLQAVEKRAGALAINLEARILKAAKGAEERALAITDERLEHWREVAEAEEENTRRILNDLEASSEEIRTHFADEIEAVEQHLKDLAVHTDEAVAALRAHIVKGADEIQAEVWEETGARLEQWREVAGESDERARRLLAELEEAAGRTELRVRDEIQGVNERMDQMRTALEELSSRLEEKMADAMREAEAHAHAFSEMELEKWKDAAELRDAEARKLLDSIEVGFEEARRYMDGETAQAEERIEEAQKRMGELGSRIEEEMAQAVDRAEARAVDLSNECIERWTKVVEAKEASAKEAVDALEDSFDEARRQAALLAAEGEGRLNAVRDEIAAAAAGIEDALAQALAGAEARARELGDMELAKWKSAAEEGEARTRELLASAEAASEEAKKRVFGELEAAEAQFEELRREMLAAGSQIEAVMKDNVVQAEDKARGLAETGLENWRATAEAREAEARRLIQDLETVSVSAQERMAGVEQRLLTIADGAEKRVLEATEERIEMWNRVTAEADANTRQLLSDLEASSAEIKTYFEGQTAAIEGQLKDARAYAHESLERLRTSVEQNTQNAEQDILAGVAARFEHLQQTVLENDEKARALVGRLENAQAAVEARFADASSSLEEQLDHTRAEAGETLAALRGQVAGMAGTLEQEVLAGVEAKLETWKQLLDSGDGKTQEMRSLLETSRVLLETFSEEIKRRFDSETGEMESRLQHTRQHIEEEFAAFERKTGEAARAIEESMAGVLLEAEQKALAGADERLAQWKQTAAETEEKTQQLLVYLENTSSELEQKLSDELERIQQQLEAVDLNTKDFAATLKNKMREAAEQAEQEVLEETDAKFEEYRAAQAQQFSNLESLADDTAKLDEELRRYVRETEAKVQEDFSAFEAASLRERERVADEFRNAAAALKQDLERIETELSALKTSAYDNVSEKLRLFEDEFAQDLLKRSEGIDTRFTEWQAAMETRLAELGRNEETAREGIEEAFNEQLKEKLGETETRFNAELDDVFKGIRNTIETRNGEISGQLDQSQKNVADWESSLNTKIQGLEASVQAARQEALDQILENDERLGVIRASIAQVSGEITAQRSEVFARIDEHARSLSAAITRADQQLEAFVKETALFDRANELKRDLDERIAALDGDFERLSEHSSEAAKLEEQFIRLKRIEEEVNAKMTKFLSEQHRIEQMEADFNRLLEISKSVDTKLAEVITSDDTLQAIQVQIRKLNDALADAEEKYRRIERKNETLETTNAGIDRNFKSLQESERMSSFINDDLRRLAGELEIMQSSVEGLIRDNTKAKETAEKLSLLDQSLSTIEERLENMQKVRQWLAQSETRLKSLKDDIDKQSSLLARGGGGGAGAASAAIPKAGAGAGKGGMPDGSQQETVLKLKRQGWTVEEIANTLGISIGEVELTLEFMNLK